MTHWPDLRGAVKDAREVHEQLKRSGIKSTLVLNPTSRELKRALNQLAYGPGKERDRGNSVLFLRSWGNRNHGHRGEDGVSGPERCPNPQSGPYGVHRYSDQHEHN